MNNDIEKAFGLSMSVTGFADGVDRNFYAFKMIEIKTFFEALNNIKHVSKLMVNYLFEDGEENLKVFFALCFKDNPFEDLEEVITIQNYPIIMKQCFEKSGLIYPEDKEESENPQKEE